MRCEVVCYSFYLYAMFRFRYWCPNQLSNSTDFFSKNDSTFWLNSRVHCDACKHSFYIPIYLNCIFILGRKIPSKVLKWSHVRKTRGIFYISIPFLTRNEVVDWYSFYLYAMFWFSYWDPTQLIFFPNITGSFDRIRERIRMLANAVCTLSSA